MAELDTKRLIACLEDGRAIARIETEADLRAFFEASATDVGRVFEEGVDQVLDRWQGEDDKIRKIRDYLLWEYIAYNIAELYNSYDLVRDMFEHHTASG